MEYLRGNWNYNNSKYPYYATALYTILSLLLMGIPLGGAYLTLKLLPKSFWSKYWVLNIAMLVAPYFYMVVSFELFKNIKLVLVDLRE